MKEYYILKDGKKNGPYTIFELKERKIYNETQVWDAESKDWYNASEFPELHHIISIPTENDIKTLSEKMDNETTNDNSTSSEPPPQDNTKVYYILVNGVRSGPFNIYQLKDRKIYFDTDVWSYEESNWLRAEDFPELRHIITEPPPGYKSTSISTYNTYFGYTLAGIGQRFLADLITGIVAALIAGIFAIPYYVYIFNLDKDSIGSSGSFLIIALFFLGLMLVGVAAGLAFRCLLYSRYCGTLGHKVMGIKVISAEDGSDYNKMTQGLVREALKSILGQVIIPVIWLLWDKDRQNLYDKVVKTYVVRRKDY